MTQAKDTIVKTRLDYTPLIEKAKTLAAMACIIVPAAVLLWLLMVAVAA